MNRARPPYRFCLSREKIFEALGLPDVKQKQEAPAPKKEDVVVKPVEEPQVEEPKVEEPVVEEPQVETPVTGTDISELGLSAKNEKILRSSNINTIEELIALGEDDLPKMSRAAKQSIMEELDKWQNAQNQTKLTGSN